MKLLLRCTLTAILVWFMVFAEYGILMHADRGYSVQFIESVLASVILACMGIMALGLIWGWPKLDLGEH